MRNIKIRITVYTVSMYRKKKRTLKEGMSMAFSNLYQKHLCGGYNTNQNKIRRFQCFKKPTHLLRSLTVVCSDQVLLPKSEEPEENL